MDEVPERSGGCELLQEDDGRVSNGIPLAVVVRLGGWDFGEPSYVEWEKSQKPCKGNLSLNFPERFLRLLE